MSAELFTLPPSAPPWIVTLRKRYEKAVATYETASAWEDETGEPVPEDVKMAVSRFERMLRNEEARLVLGHSSSVIRHSMVTSPPSDTPATTACPP